MKKIIITLAIALLPFNSFAYTVSAPRSYSAPIRTYTPPVRTYTPPVRTYTSPVRSYNPSPRVYTPSKPVTKPSVPVTRPYVPTSNLNDSTNYVRPYSWNPFTGNFLFWWLLFGNKSTTIKNSTTTHATSTKN